MHARHFQAGHLQIENPLRFSDLVHTQASVLAHTEELFALDKLELARVEPFTWGFLVKPRLSHPYTEWADTLHVRRHLWMDSAERDRFATTVFLSHAFRTDSTNPFHRPLNSPRGACTALCLWYCAKEAAAYIRHEVIGPPLLNAYGPTDLFSITATEIVRDLALSEGALNSTVLPHYCQSELKGILLRIDRINVARVLDYFLIEEPVDDSIPTVFAMGGLVNLVYAAVPSEVRIAVCPEHCTSLAIDSLSRWLRGPKRGAKKETLLTT
jgi:hypothetical protein